MKARRTIQSNMVLTLPGGTEDNDLWVHMTRDEAGASVIESTWVPTEEEREAIASGANIQLLVWGEVTPPVFVGITGIMLGKKVEPVAPCRKCGCTETNACVLLKPEEFAGSTCGWVEPDLCSACVENLAESVVWKHPEVGS